MQALQSSFVSRALRPFLILALLLGVLLQANALGVFSGTPAPDAPTAPAIPALTIRSPQQIEGLPAIEGWATDARTGEAVPGAVVRLNDRVEVRADASGHFAFSLQHLLASGATSVAEAQQVQVAVRAAGYNDWQVSKALYRPGDTLRVHPRLGSAGQPAPALLTYLSRAGSASLHNTQSSALSPQSSTSALTLPATIRVYRTATGVVEVVRFRDYVKYSLPSEWIPSWSPEALKAGAIAVKAYGWYWVSVGGKQVALGADVKDNVEDQIYDPNISYASTDAAVDATFDYAITRNGSLFQAQYCAGGYDGDPVGDCPWPGPYMTQWGSAYWADQGKKWGWILQFYYTGSTIAPAPPGGGYSGPSPWSVTPTPQPPAATPRQSNPAPATTPAPTAPPYVPPAAGNFTVGQNSPRPDVFQEAYARHGGEQALGRPTGPVRWWLQYVTEHNMLAQPFSGRDGKGSTWLVYDTLKAGLDNAHRAYLLAGDIALAYANNTPPGPEWIGAPVSDPYVDASGVPSQGFARGTLSGSGQSVKYTPWPQQFAGWKAEYFIGYQQPSAQQAPQLNLTGRPALVKNVDSPNMDWPPGSQGTYNVGVGKGEWSAQFTRELEVEGGTYDFTLRADSGARLWVNGVLAINGWYWDGSQGAAGSATYSADLARGRHTIRVQYYSPRSSARLDLQMAPRGVAAPVPAPPPTAQAQPPAGGGASARVRVQWLGRGPAPSDAWVQPLTLFLSNPANPADLKSFRGTTDRNGVALYQNLPVGTYNVHVKGQRSLQSARANVTLAANAIVDLDMNAQVMGDVDGNNCVTVDDFAAVQAMLGASRSMPGFNSAADLNGDGVVTMSDISLLRSGFDLCGDISVDDQFRTMSTNAAPSLSQALEPWRNPDSLQRDLTLSLLPTAEEVRVGGTVDLHVVADTKTQPIDGASFIIRYDPNKLTPIDAFGNEGTMVEPGVMLPAVMGNWIDRKGGAIGYSASVLHGEPPKGHIVVTTLRFRVGGAPGQTEVSFAPLPSPHVQLTYGGANLLASASGTTLLVKP